jgi:hypothetical protein
MNRRKFLQASALTSLLAVLPAWVRKPPVIPPQHEWRTFVQCNQSLAGVRHDIRSCAFKRPVMEGMTVCWIHFQGHEAVFGFQPIELAGEIPYDKVHPSGV